ncbi:MAG: sigma-70 family RNA polymerase sigma factor [Candidatus Poribacteria bacterium]|nr:sigma-70 family RNA polymerase sigma factor [Candidatus Poribacteria bacterium]
MLENDVQLIQRILSGDDSAFNTLVERHHKGVHALIWRKIGDFHYAEELTQDVFLQVYKKLGTLKDPKCFAGWLYVIANRLTLNWIQRHKPAMQSLEETPLEEIDESSYTHYVTLEREADAAEQNSEIVKKLLERLPESERTVVTLYYLGEMTVKEIGNFLGVSVNTIKSRLRRGRERLQEAESLVSKVLGSVQLPADLTARIMRQVADINPTVPPAGKPLVPWVSFGAATILVMLLLGASHQYLARFQKPYSFEARSEPTIEIVDAPIVLDVVSKPSIRNQFGRSAVPGKNVGAGMEFSEATLRTYSEEDLRKFSITQWGQTDGPPGGKVHDIYTVSDGTTFAISRGGMYKLETEATAWRYLSTSIPIDKSLMPMVENRGTLYIVSTNEIFASVDKGETWRAFCVRPKGDAIGFITTDERDARGSEAGMTMYLALRDEGIFRSIDGGIEWESLNDGLGGERISAITAVQKTMFTGTNRGLYRLDSDIWRKLSIGTSKAVYSLAVLKSNLYVGMGPDLVELTPMDASSIVQRSEPSSGRIFRSADLGASWTEITPKYRPSALPSGVKLLVTGETLLALGATNLCSMDRGDTWTNLGIDTNLYMLNSLPAAAVNDETFYKAGAFGIHRTTDGGKSWHIFMDGVLGTRIYDLVVFNNRLYAYTTYEVYQSVNQGISWKKVRIGTEEVSRKSVKDDGAYIYPNLYAKFVIAGGMLYFISPEINHLRISRLSADDNKLIPVQTTPAFDSEGARESQVSETTRSVEEWARVEAFAISGDVFYAEYNRRLFKWRLGDSAWKDTGLVDFGKPSDVDFLGGFKLAASREILYVGKRDGRLFQSLDEGTNWRDVTPNLPLRFTSFKEIAFVGSTVYVATDAGVLVSETGEHWRVIMDRSGAPIVINQFAMNHFAVTGPRVYGAGDMGVYGMDADGHWKRFASEVPGKVVSLDIINNKLYGATKDRAIFQISLAEEW